MTPPPTRGRRLPPSGGVPVAGCRAGRSGGCRGRGLAGGRARGYPRGSAERVECPWSVVVLRGCRERHGSLGRRLHGVGLTDALPDARSECVAAAVSGIPGGVLGLGGGRGPTRLRGFGAGAGAAGVRCRGWRGVNAAWALMFDLIAVYLSVVLVLLGALLALRAVGLID